MKNETGTAPVTRYKELLEILAKQHKLPMVKVKAVIDGMVALSAEHLKSGKRVQFGGLGSLFVRDAPVKTGDKVGAAGVAATKRVALAVAKEFKSISGV